MCIEGVQLARLRQVASFSAEAHWTVELSGDGVTPGGEIVSVEAGAA